MLQGVTLLILVQSLPAVLLLSFLKSLWWHACSCDGIFIPDIDIANIYNLDQSYTVSSQCVLSPEPSTQTFCPAVRTDAAHKRHMSQYARHHLYNSWRVLQAVRVEAWRC